MADYPAFPLWTDAYLADTMHLTDAEHGLYLLMLIHLWRTPKQRFPNDDQWLARKFGMTLEQVRTELRPLIKEFLSTDDENCCPYGAMAERHVYWAFHPSRLLRAEWRIIRRSILDSHENICEACNDKHGPFEVDHIVPRCLGGTHAWDNLQILCRPCNRAKGGRLQ